MSRILKSSYVKLGERIEIQVEQREPLEEEKIQREDSNELEMPTYEEIYEQKIQEIEREIQKKKDSAVAEAEEIINGAYENAKKIHQNAKQDGYKEGLDEGYADGKKEADALIREALAIKEEIIESKKRKIGMLENDIIRLVIDTTEKILNTKIQEDYEIIMGLIKLGLEKCTYTDSLIIRVSPEDYEYVLSVKEKILCLAENINDIHVKQDAALKKGSCIIDTLSGSIDSSIETQFSQIKELFMELLESGS
ncbi:MAG: FliH/SctL family protein [Thermotaleaceae bacterium]